MSECVTKEELAKCKIRYNAKFAAVNAIRKIKDTYLGTTDGNYAEWDKWMQIEIELMKL